MNPDDLARILDELGQRLGPTGEYVFALAVRQAWINGLMSLGLALVGVVVTIAVVLSAWGYHRRAWAKYNAKKPNGSGYWSGSEPDVFYPLLFGGVASLFGVLLSAMGVSFGLPNILNPEYAALRDILGAIR